MRIGLRSPGARADPELAALARAYLAKRTKEPALIAAAVERRDFDAIHKIGHNLLGSGEMFGFAELSREPGEHAGWPDLVWMERQPD